MEMEFRNRKVNIKKLLSYGFIKDNESYIYSTDLVDGEMKMVIVVSKDGKANAQVFDNVSGEEYILHLVPSAEGSFVGQVKAEYEGKLDEIFAKCFDFEVFKSKQAKDVINYILERYGGSLEYLWEKFPDNAVVRRDDNKKWYAAILTVSRRKLGFDSDEMAEVLDLRMRTEDIEIMLDNKRYFPGYHMNKKHWISVCLDGTVPIDEICDRIDESYKLAIK